MEKYFFEFEIILIKWFFILSTHGKSIMDAFRLGVLEGMLDWPPGCSFYSSRSGWKCISSP